MEPISNSYTIFESTSALPCLTGSQLLVEHAHLERAHFFRVSRCVSALIPRQRGRHRNSNVSAFSIAVFLFPQVAPCALLWRMS